MRIFIDTNIIMELLANRSKADIIDEIFDESEEKGWSRYISVGSFYTLTYLVERVLKQTYQSRDKLMERLRYILSDILTAFDISPISSTHLMQGVNNSAFSDLEDSYQHQAAILAECDVLLTINNKDFKLVDNIKVLTPDEFKEEYL